MLTCMVLQGDRGKTGAPGLPGEMGPMVRSKSGLSNQIFFRLYSEGMGWDLFGENG